MINDPFNDPFNVFSEYEEPAEVFEPEEEDIFISPNWDQAFFIGRVIAQQNGGIDNQEELLEQIRNWAEVNNYWPNIWHDVGERGIYNLVDPNTGDYISQDYISQDSRQPVGTRNPTIHVGAMSLKVFTVDWVSRDETLHHTDVLTSSQETADEYVRKEYAATYLRPGEPMCGCKRPLCNICSRYAEDGSLRRTYTHCPTCGHATKD